MQKWGCHGPHPKFKKNFFFAEITKPGHKLSKTFYFIKMSYVLAIAKLLALNPVVYCDMLL